MGVAAWGVIDLYFFECAVNWGEGTLEQMLNEFVQPEFSRRRRLSCTLFQQDGVTCHTAKETMVCLKGMFNNHVISRNTQIVWPSGSPNLCVIFICGFGGGKVQGIRMQTLRPGRVENWNLTTYRGYSQDDVQESLW